MKKNYRFIFTDKFDSQQVLFDILDSLKENHLMI